MIQISAQELMVGDKYYDATYSEKYGCHVPVGRNYKSTEVKKKEFCGRHSLKVHINEHLCYELLAPVFRV